MEVIAIEFDKSRFEDPYQCKEWLKDNLDYQPVLDNKNFKLKTVKRSILMSYETRPVLAWYGNLHKYKKFETLRPENDVLVIIKCGNESWSEGDLPDLSEQTKKRQEMLAKKELAKHKLAKLRAMEREQRKLQRSLNKPIKVKKPKDSRAYQNLRKAKELSDESKKLRAVIVGKKRKAKVVKPDPEETDEDEFNHVKDTPEMEKLYKQLDATLSENALPPMPSSATADDALRSAADRIDSV